MDQWKNKAMDQRSRQSNGPKTVHQWKAMEKNCIGPLLHLLHWSIALFSPLVHWCWSIALFSPLVHWCWSIALFSPLVHWCWSIALSSPLAHCIIFSMGPLLYFLHWSMVVSSPLVNWCWSIGPLLCLLHWSTALSSPLIYWCCFISPVDWQSGGSAHAPEWHQSPRSHSFSHSNAAQPATASPEPQRQHFHQERGDCHGTGTLEKQKL